jgi:hypothetical protein
VSTLKVDTIRPRSASTITFGESGDTIAAGSGVTITGFGTTISNDANNRLTTADGSGGLNGEANMTFDGTNLTVIGNVGIGTNSAASKLDVRQDGQNTITVRSVTNAGYCGIEFSDQTTGGYTQTGFFKYTHSDGVSDGAGSSFRLGTSEASQNYIFVISGSTEVGKINTISSGTTYNTTSDYRLKDNIEIITDGTERLMNLKPIRHSWKESSGIVDGFLAHEVQEAGLEYAVTGEKDGKYMQSMDYGRITPVIVSALQDAIKEINNLKQRIKELESK